MCPYERTIADNYSIMALLDTGDGEDIKEGFAAYTSKSKLDFYALPDVALKNLLFTQPSLT